MKKIVVLGAVVALAGILPVSAANVEYLKGKGYEVVKVPMDGTNKILTPAVASGGTPKSLKQFVQESGASYGINGAFFCPKGYSWCKPNTSEKARKDNGQLKSHYGYDIGEGNAMFGFGADGKVAPMAVQLRGDAYWKNGTWYNPGVDAIYNGIENPALVKDGVNVASQNKIIMSDAKQKKAANKTFICSTIGGETVYMGFVDGVTPEGLAEYIIKNFACHNAILLDNGGTKAMFVKDKYVAGPGRDMMDAFVVVEEGSSQSSPEKTSNQPSTSVTSDTAVASKVSEKNLIVRGILEQALGKLSVAEQQSKLSVIKGLAASYPSDATWKIIYDEVVAYEKKLESNK